MGFQIVLEGMIGGLFLVYTASNNVASVSAFSRRSVDQKQLVPSYTQRKTSQLIT
ncbi:hypothetical protein HP15_p187g139 (plasmid) [Marinobacter adhaerens HP15]|uniref:Uncharacterized protein n=1 Tax=Marinobacter adhaerens (strain DSM 23420 / HP15) TaxID=225937 RepID=E4PSA0_MARAH|nr:hypothetical protein HP15_p187g139 [Marinobacter adhaerens HP15]